MATKQFHNQKLSKTFDRFGQLVRNTRPVYTIIKHDDTCYDLIDYQSRQVYISHIPFKLTAERLMDQLNQNGPLPKMQHQKYQEACHQYRRLRADLPFLESAAQNSDPTRRRIAQARLDLADARIATIENFLFIK